MAKLEFSAGGVAILGVGREGKATRKYLRSLYPDIRLTLVTETAPGPEFERQLTEYDRLLTGPLSAAGLDNFDLLVRSPGISPYRNSVKAARAAGVAITTPSNLWFESHADQNTICVTGTKGKSTTSALLAHLLRFCGHNVRLAGNIGLPLLDCDDHAVDWWVIELSSYQLADLDARPTLSVILNLSAEHLDWHQSERAYRSDKLRLAELTADRPLIANADDPVLRASLRKRSNITWFNSASGFRVDGNALFDGVKQLPVTLPEGLPGAHNLANAAAALTVLRAIEVNMDNAIEGISSFRCLPHRLQLIGEKERPGLDTIYGHRQVQIARSHHWHSRHWRPNTGYSEANGNPPGERAA
jgi:UDP-N-acetylmuramoylalanine--D-glutamate ligase